MPPTFSLLSLTTPIPIPFSPPRSNSSFPLSRPFFRPPLSSSSSSPLSTSSTFFPYSIPYPHQNPNQEQEAVDKDGDDDEDDDDEEVVIGDCLVFEEGAFEDGDPFLRSNHSRGSERPARRKAANAVAEPESLVPEKWKEAVEEINLSKKDKRKIAYELRFGSKLERRKPPTLPDMEEYKAYKEMKLAQLNPVVLDEPKELTPEKELAVAAPPVSGMERLSGGRVAPKNPRSGSDGGSLEDITEFLNSGDYVPGEMDDDKKPRSRRKLFTDEEKVLLNKRIPDLGVATSNKWLPLHTIAASGEFYVLDRLLKHNVDINAVDKDGLSAIHKAILCKKQAIVNYLLRNSANPFVRDKDGATLMHYAVQTASIETIKILLLYNVDINLSDDDGWTPLHLAVQTQRTDIVKLLLIKGANRTIRNHDGLTPLEMCLHFGRHLRTYEFIKLLKGFPSSKPPV
ncbi:ankyrin repeat domain-containing protein, chloroplastic [Typha latifolia]|uniref:ankyrin repeat domain-containing protein, chloroplastic n=1 Tax=Typha latifolia TaxID=4733 RepID=UPI003C2E51D8